MSTPKCCMHEGEVERGIHTQGMRQVEGGIITQNKGGNDTGQGVGLLPVCRDTSVTNLTSHPHTITACMHKPPGVCCCPHTPQQLPPGCEQQASPSMAYAL